MGNGDVRCTYNYNGCFFMVDKKKKKNFFYQFIRHSY